jgi:hypothetical protein
VERTISNGALGCYIFSIHCSGKLLILVADTKDVSPVVFSIQFPTKC